MLLRMSLVKLLRRACAELHRGGNRRRRLPGNICSRQPVSVGILIAFISKSKGTASVLLKARPHSKGYISIVRLHDDPGSRRQKAGQVLH